jgi:soluble lytic murein transglycosylase-like protein
MKLLSRLLFVLGLGLAQASVADAARRGPEALTAGKPSPREPALDLSRTLWAEAARPRGLDPYLLYAVALVESARVSGGWARPWPWALNQAGRTSYPATSGAALARMRDSLAAGRQVIDVGLMQVNVHWHGRRVESLDALLDPVTNVLLGADILAEAIASAPGDLALGVGRYHAWQDRPAAYRYGRKVLALADRLRRPGTW